MLFSIHREGEATVADTLAVKVNRDRPYQIDPASESLETPGSFTLVLKNEGAGRHVNIRLEGTLANTGSIDADTHFIGNGALWSTTVAVEEQREPVSGTLIISLGMDRKYARFRF